MNATYPLDFVYCFEPVCYNRPTLSSKNFITDIEFAKLKRGDHVVFQKVYEMHYGLVRFTCLKIRLSPDDIDEVIQETFIKLFHKAASIDDPANLKQWLVITARHTAIDAIRKRRNQGVTHAIDNELDIADDLHDDYDFETSMRVLEHVVKEQLSTEEQKLIDDFYFHNMSARDIAIEQSVAVSTITTRLSRIRIRIAEHLEKRLKIDLRRK